MMGKNPLSLLISIKVQALRRSAEGFDLSYRFEREEFFSGRSLVNTVMYKGGSTSEAKASPF